MPLKVMKQLGLNITRPYKKVCGCNSKLVEVEGLIKDLNVSLAMNPDISLLMDIVVIDVLDVWGMFLSRKWGATIGGHLQMDLSYATIPQSDAVKPGLIPYYKTHEIEKPSPILPSQEFCVLKRPNHKANKKWKPNREYKVGDVVLVDKNPMPVKIHGNVEENYYYIAKLNKGLWPQLVKLTHITSFLDT